VPHVRAKWKLGPDKRVPLVVAGDVARINRWAPVLLSLAKLSEVSRGGACR